MTEKRIHRRTFHAGSLSAALIANPLARAAHATWVDAPKQLYGIMAGEVTSNSAVIWGRSDCESQMEVEWDTAESFSNPRRVIFPPVNALSDFTSHGVLQGLPSGADVFYRVAFRGRDGAGNTVSDSIAGRLKLASETEGDLFFAWSGDTAGQGFGINLEWGGMRMYSAIERIAPQFFIHSGDMIYADNPIAAEMKLTDGTIWKNVVTSAKSHAASTLDDFRGNYQYNLMDKPMQSFHRNVPLYVAWDDHETTNNWYPQQMLRKRRDAAVYDALEYGSQLANRAKQAFFEYTPILPSASGEPRIYRQVSRGPSLDLFFLDMRTYRGPNSSNNQSDLRADSAILGAEQLAWLKRSLAASRATWKVICSDMPLGIIVGDNMEGEAYYEAVSNRDPGIPSGRELEIQDLLSWMKESGVRNTVWITADIHYAAAHYYNPQRAARPNSFLPFWEFVAGPLHAGTFGPNELDGTFGPELKFQWAPQPGTKLPLPPSAGMQSFGTIRIDGKTKKMTVEFRGLDGNVLPDGTIELEPQL